MKHKHELKTCPFVGITKTLAYQEMSQHFSLCRIEFMIYFNLNELFFYHPSSTKIDGAPLLWLMRSQENHFTPNRTQPDKNHKRILNPQNITPLDCLAVKEGHLALHLDAIANIVYITHKKHSTSKPQHMYTLHTIPQRKEKTTSMYFTLTCDVHSPPPSNVCVNVVALFSYTIPMIVCAPFVNTHGTQRMTHA